MQNKFKEYLQEIDQEELDNIWLKQSKKFRDFWKNKIIDESYPELTDSEIDEIVLILDKNAKGSTKKTVAVARAMIPQGAWRRLFKEIQSNKELKITIYNLLNENDEKKSIDLINAIYKLNETRKNNLTGKNGNAINAMLFAYNPQKYIPAISLNDRRKIIENYSIENDINWEKDSQGDKIIKSNKVILEWFKRNGLNDSPYICTSFLYKKLKENWKTSSDIEEETTESPEDIKVKSSETRFYMEKELENFLIKNWDVTELGALYDLIMEEGEMKSQQYQTKEIGDIDILVQDKKTGEYVIIELKKDQTSDKTVGQILRYMGWVKDNLSKGQSVKGIIIAASYDRKLFYAIKDLPNIEVYIYQVDFKLKEFEKTIKK